MYRFTKQANLLNFLSAKTQVWIVATAVGKLQHSIAFKPTPDSIAAFNCCLYSCNRQFVPEALTIKFPQMADEIKFYTS